MFLLPLFRALVIPSLNIPAASDKSLSSSHSQLFLDSACTEDWKKHIPFGIFHGITTNPILLQRANVRCTIPELRGLTRVALEDYNVNCFMIQAWGKDTASLIKCALELQDFSDKVVVKLPLTSEGVKAAAVVIKMKVRVCMTACYSSKQVITASSLGAEYLAPYLGRMIDAGKDGMAEVVQMQRMVEGLRSPMRIFVASIRDPDQLASLSAAGLHTFTFSPLVAERLLLEALTESASNDFENAAHNM